MLSAIVLPEWHRMNENEKCTGLQQNVISTSFAYSPKVQENWLHKKS